MSNERVILQRRHLNFEEIYGQEWEEKQRDLFKYCVKSFGCRLVDAGEMVPQDLVDLLALTSFRTALKVTFAVNEDVLLMPQDDRAGFIAMGDLFSTTAKGYLWCESVSWFRIHYWYSCQPDGALGSTWIANAQYVYLGSEAPLPSEMRADLLAKASRKKVAPASLDLAAQGFDVSSGIDTADD
ncbi:hypothetical protein ACVW1A_007175 [Bradyrhizobium sp. LB1.3]